MKEGKRNYRDHEPQTPSASGLQTDGTADEQSAASLGLYVY